MSSFLCDKCAAPIIEGPTGRYVTGCEHYPVDNATKLDNELAAFCRTEDEAKAWANEEGGA